MKKTSIVHLTDGQTHLAINKPKQIFGGLILTAGMLTCHYATAQSVPLGSTTNFAVLAGSGITVAGAVNSTVITGNIGSYPTTSVTGLGNVTLTGVNQSSDTGVMIAAKNDLTTAFNTAAGAPATTSYTPIQDLGGLTLLPGVYYDPSSFGITGTLTLNANGDPNAIFIIQAGSTLTTASSSEVDLIGGAQADNVFWEVGSSATLGEDSGFEGNILADTSITAGTGVTVDGRLLADTGAVTLDGSDTISMPVDNTVLSTPDGGSTLLLLGSGVSALFVLRRRFSAL